MGNIGFSKARPVPFPFLNFARALYPQIRPKFILLLRPTVSSEFALVAKFNFLFISGVNALGVETDGVMVGAVDLSVACRGSAVCYNGIPIVLICI